MFTLSDRCAILREETVNRQEQDEVLIGQYRYHYDMRRFALADSVRDPGLLRAHCLCAVIEGYPPVIFEGELIVGNNYGADRIMREEYMLFHDKTEPTFDEADETKGEEPWARAVRDHLARGRLSAAQIDALIDAHRENARRTRGQSATPEAPLRPEDERLLTEEQAAGGYCLAYNHTILGYAEVLKYGFAGLSERVRATRETRKAGETLTAEEEALYDGAEMIAEAARTLGRRFARAARAQAGSANEERADELRTIARVCERVPEYPAETFYEAVQSLWFAHVINTWEDGVNANSLGRLDQILYPYYQRDIDAGILTKERAFELICCLFLKLYRDYDVQQSTIGGCDAQGRCAVNDLSYLMLDAIEALDFVRCMSVRISASMPKPFLCRALEVVSHVQKGVPFFFNDDVLIDALHRRGIALEDARDYAPVGCVEICVPGKANPHAVTGYVNLLKALEYALCDGGSLYRQDTKPGISTGDPASFKTFEALLSAVRAQLRRLCEVTCAQVNRAIPLSARLDGLFYKSLLTEGCIERGKHFNAGGPLYNYYQIMLMGIPNLADSLAAIRKFVYEDGRYTLPELIDILRADFPDEAVRQAFIRRAPKFGNDLPEVDGLAAEMMDLACEDLRSIPSAIGQGFHAQPFTFLWMHDKGRLSGASADGRRAGEILAYSVSPMQGRDFKGLTALLNSLTALPTHKAPATTSAIVEVDPYLFSDKNIHMMAEILLVAAGRGLCNIQFNTIGRETLVDAKLHPENHRNLAVRVSGFSQKFVLLDEKMQDHIINRTKHAAL